MVEFCPSASWRPQLPGMFTDCSTDSTAFWIVPTGGFWWILVTWFCCPSPSSAWQRPAQNRLGIWLLGSKFTSQSRSWTITFSMDWKWKSNEFFCLRRDFGDLWAPNGFRLRELHSQKPPQLTLAGDVSAGLVHISTKVSVAEHTCSQGLWQRESKKGRQSV